MEVAYLLCGLFWQRTERLSRWLLFVKVLSSFPPHLTLKCATWESCWMPLLFVVSCFCWYVTAVVQKQSLLDHLFHLRVYNAHCNCVVDTIDDTVSLCTASVAPLCRTPNAINTQSMTFLRHSDPLIFTRKCITGSFPSVFLGYLY